MRVNILAHSDCLEQLQLDSEVHGGQVLAMLMKNGPTACSSKFPPDRFHTLRCALGHSSTGGLRHPLSQHSQ